MIEKVLRRQKEHLCEKLSRYQNMRRKAWHVHTGDAWQLNNCNDNVRVTFLRGHVNKKIPKIQKDFGSGWVSSVQLEILKNVKIYFYTLFYYVFGRAFERQ